MSNINNKRIVKNTILLYIRMLLIMAVSLYTSRLILLYLGVEDFGIYNVVGGIVAMLSFLNSTLSSTCQRYFSYELGRGDKDKLAVLFKLNVTLYIFFMLIVLLIAETLGLWFINTFLTIPLGRVEAMNWAYQFSLLTIVVSSLSIPYNALIISHEQMSVYAYISIIEALIKLLIVFLLKYSGGDKLILYSALLFLATSLVSFMYYLFCRLKYEESRYSFFWNLKKVREIASYSGWHLLGAVSIVFRNQGVNILINLFFNPAVNAARTVSFQVATAVDSLTNNFFTAVKPQIYKLYGANEVEKMHFLLSMSSKICFLLVAMLAYPVLLNAEYILGLWLVEIPSYTVLFTLLVLINAIVESVNGPANCAALASGKIKLFEIVVGGMMILNLPISYILLKLGCEPQVTMLVSILLSFLIIIIRAFILESLVGYNAIKYLRNVIFPLLIIALFTPIPAYFIASYFSESLLRLGLTTSIVELTLFLLFFYIGMSKSEQSIFKAYCLKGVVNLKYKICGK